VIWPYGDMDILPYGCMAFKVANMNVFQKHQ
jgi:hypothetical protein